MKPNPRPYGQRSDSRRRKGLKSLSRSRFVLVHAVSWLPIWEVPTASMVRILDTKYNSGYLTKFRRRLNNETRQYMKHTGHSYALASGLWIKIFERELLRRKDNAYRGFINMLIHEPATKANTYFVFADWLAEHDRHMESRKVLQFCREVGMF